MDMTKEALQFITGMKEPYITNIDGENYSDKPLTRISYNPKAKCLKMSTLTSLVDYIKAKVDSMDEKMLVHVESPECVRLVSMLDDEREREEIVEVIASVPQFNYGKYMDHESFLIAMQSKFLPGEDRDLILKFAGTVESGTVATYGDDGVSQKATVKKGIAGKEDALVPNPVRLCPFRTFVEVDQPESAFVFRMRDYGDGVECAVFEADGGAWRNVAMKNIAEYLKHELEELKQFTVIS